MEPQDRSYIESLVRAIPDFPQPGIIFRDITTVIKDAKGFTIIMDDLVDRYREQNIDYVMGAEARGFIFGAALAYAIGAGFVPARKPGKLPAQVLSASYNLEYGSNSIEVHKDAIHKGARVLLVDDLLATGGTAKAMTQLVEELEAQVVELAFVIELEDLKGRDLLAPYSVYSQLTYWNLDSIAQDRANLLEAKARSSFCLLWNP